MITITKKSLKIEVASIISHNMEYTEVIQVYNILKLYNNNIKQYDFLFSINLNTYIQPIHIKMLLK